MSVVRLQFDDNSEYTLPVGTIVCEPIYDEVIGVCGEVISRTHKSTVITVTVKGDNPIQKLKDENKALRSRLQHLLKSEYIASFDKKEPGTTTYVRDIYEADNNLLPVALNRAANGLLMASRLITEAGNIIKEGKKCYE